MKSSYLAWFVAGLVGSFAFTQYQAINKLRDRVSASEQYWQVLTAGLDKSTNERLELIRQITDLKNQLRFSTATLAPTLDETTVFDEDRSDVPMEKSRDRVQYIGSTTTGLSKGYLSKIEEVEFIIEKYNEKFQTVDIGAYSGFLDSINMDEADKQNVLVQLIDNNKERVTKMLYHCLESQISGLAGDGDGEYKSLINDLGSFAVMNRNLDQSQFNRFLEFEVNRLTKGPISVEASLWEVRQQLNLNC